MHFNFHSTPTWTLKSRVQTVTTTNQAGSFPGPADYKDATDTVKNKAPAFVMGTAKREVFNAAAVGQPGPGAYELKSLVTDGPKKTMSKRLEEQKGEKTPGPQYYNPDELKTKKSEPKFSIRLRSKSYQDIQRTNNLYQPAPGTYELQGSFNNPKGVIGSAVRKELHEMEKSTPGPGSYLTIDKLDKSKMLNSTTNPRCSIGTSPRKTAELAEKNNNPGRKAYLNSAGAYAQTTFLQENFTKKKGYSMRAQTVDLRQMELAKVPGPGQYDPTMTHRSKSPEYRYGSSRRLTFVDGRNQNTPGPGVHEAVPDFGYKTSPCFKFGSANRKSLYENEKTPGPGNYNEHGIKVLPMAPKFSVPRSRSNLQYLKDQALSPAPNIYNPKYELVKESPRKSFTTTEQRPNFNKAAKLPGPGHYAGKSQLSGPSWGFGTERRTIFTENKESSRVPSSTMYNIPKMVPNPPTYMHVTDKVQFAN